MRASGRSAVLAATSWMAAVYGCTCTGSRGEAPPPAPDAPDASDTTGASAAPAAAGTGAGSAAASSKASADTASASVAAGAAGTASAAGPPATPPAPAAPALAWTQKLGPLLFRDVNTLANVTLRLYRADGAVDEEAAAEVERVLWSSKEDDAGPRMSRRLLQLVVKAAAHFEAQEVHVISSHRGGARKGSRHRSGEAIDFVFPGVPAKQLADVLRAYARVGVGLYVHPRSQYVHLDVREQSYHWVDGSPPGRSWKEQALPDPSAAARDAAYTPEQDLPSPPAVPVIPR